MENASKALLMAAGVLIGILVLSLAVYLFISFGASAREVNNRIEESKLTQFNAQFNVYEGRTDVTIYDIISLGNLAKENNEYYKDYSNYKIKIEVEFINDSKVRDLSKCETSEKLHLINTYRNDKDGDEILFSCTTVKYNENGRIKRVRFLENKKE